MINMSQNGMPLGSLNKRTRLMTVVQTDEPVAVPAGMQYLDSAIRTLYFLPQAASERIVEVSSAPARRIRPV